MDIMFLAGRWRDKGSWLAPAVSLENHMQFGRLNQAVFPHLYAVAFSELRGKLLSSFGVH